MSAAGVPGRGEYLNENAAAEADLLDQRQGVGEIRVGLAGEADDEIGGEREIAAARRACRSITRR